MLLEVAELLRPHGTRGELAARLAGVEPEQLRGMALKLRRRDGTTVDTVVRSVRPGPAGSLVALQGVSDRTAAEALRGSRLLARREDLPPTGEGEWWIADLVGLRVVAEDGAELGVLEEVLKLPANDVLVVRGGAGEILVPLLEGVVLSVAAGTMTIAVPPGLLDAPLPEAPEEEG